MEPGGLPELHYYFAESDISRITVKNSLNSFDPTSWKQFLEWLYHLGIPETPDIIGLPAEIHSDEVVLKWTKPNSNGADITQYTVYKRNVTSNDTVGDWRKLEVIYDVSILEYVVTLEKGQQYEFLVTATNKYGESLKTQQNIKRIKVLEGKVMAIFPFFWINWLVKLRFLFLATL